MPNRYSRDIAIAPGRDPIYDIWSDVSRRTEQKAAERKANEMGFGEWASRSGEQFGVKDAPVYGMVSRVSPVSGPLNRARQAAASRFGNDDTGWNEIKGLSPTAVKRMLTQYFLHDENVSGQLWSNLDDDAILREMLYYSSRNYLTTRKGFEREQEDRKPTGSRGLMDRGARGAIDMFGYMGQIALGPEYFIASESLGRYAEARAPGVELGDKGELRTSRAPVGRGEAALKAVGGAAITYAIEKVVGEAVGKVFRTGGGAAYKAAVPKRGQAFVRLMGQKTRGTWVNSAWSALGKADRVTGFNGLFEEIFVEEGIEAAVNALLDLEYDYRNSGMDWGARLSDSMKRFVQATPEMAISMTLSRSSQFGASLAYAAAKNPQQRREMRKALAALYGDEAAARSISDRDLPEALARAVNDTITDGDAEEVVRDVVGRMKKWGFEVDDDAIDAQLRAMRPDADTVQAEDTPFDEAGHSLPVGAVDLITGSSLDPQTREGGDEGDAADAEEMHRRETEGAEQAEARPREEAENNDAYQGEVAQGENANGRMAPRSPETTAEPAGVREPAATEATPDAKGEQGVLETPQDTQEAEEESPSAVSSYQVGEKVWFQGDEITIATPPYELHGGTWQDGVTEAGKTVTVATPGQRDAEAMAAQEEWERQQEGFARLRDQEAAEEGPPSVGNGAVALPTAETGIAEQSESKDGRPPQPDDSLTTRGEIEERLQSVERQIGKHEGVRNPRDYSKHEEKGKRLYARRDSLQARLHELDRTVQTPSGTGESASPADESTAAREGEPPVEPAPSVAEPTSPSLSADDTTAQDEVRRLLEGPLPTKKVPKDERIDIADIPDGPIAIPEHHRAYPKVKGVVPALSVATNNDSSRPAGYVLNMVKVDADGIARASNGKLAVFVPTAGEAGRYPEGHYATNGQPATASMPFPETRQYIPERANGVEAFRVPLEPLLRVIRGVETAEKRIALPEKAPFFPVMLRMPHGAEAKFDPKMMAAALRPLWSTGTTHLDMHIKSWDSPAAFFDSSDAARVSVLMPVNPKETDGYRLVDVAAMAEPATETESPASGKAGGKEGKSQAKAPRPAAVHPDALAKFADAIEKLDTKALQDWLQPDNRALRAEFERQFAVKLPSTWSKTKGWIADWAERQRANRDRAMAFAREFVADREVTTGRATEDAVANSPEASAKLTITRELRTRLGQLAQQGEQGMAAYKVVSANADEVLASWTDYVYDTVKERIDQRQRDAHVKGEEPVKQDTAQEPQITVTPPTGALSNLSAEKQAKAAELIARMKGGFNRLNEGMPDPTLMSDGIQLAALYVESGIRRFADFAREMYGVFGAKAKSYMRAWWAGAQDAADAPADMEDVSRDEARKILDGLAASGETKADNIESERTETGSAADEQHAGDRQEDQGGGEEGALVRDGDRGRRAGTDAGGVGGAAPENAEGAPAARGGQVAGEAAGGEAVRGNAPEHDDVADAADRRTGTGGEELVPDRGRGRRASGRKSGGRAGQGRDVRQTPADDGGGVASKEVQPNYRIRDPEALVGGGAKTRFARNQKAIETYLTVNAQGRPATDAERDAIAAYTGWGSFGQELFNGSWEVPRPKEEWKEENAWLRDQLGESEWKSAQRSILNAHYTDPPTVAAMWEMVRRMGFRGGRVLEPSMGIGNFFGLMPEDIAARSDMTGIELDELTGGMAQLLYPQANISVKGYQDSQTPDGFYDLVIGNWPFAADGPADRRYNRLAPSLHDYFFLKALDQVRPGGLVVGITSSGTMDKVGQQVRLEMSKKADLVGSFRLPSGAFQKYAGTKVVTDVIVLRKRDEDAGMWRAPGWVQTAEVDTPSGHRVRVNRHYADNQEDILGTLDWGHGTTTGRPGMVVERTADFEDRLQRAVNSVPQGSYKERRTARTERYVTNNAEDRVNSVMVDEDGELWISQGEQKVRFEDRKRIALKDAKATERRREQIRRLVEIRKTLGDLIDEQREGADGMEATRARLRKQYRAFVKAHGPINGGFALAQLQQVNDPHFPQLAALERNVAKPGDKAKYVEATILSRSTTRPKPRPEKLSVSDAYIFQRNENLALDMGRVAELAKTTEEEAAAELLANHAVFRSAAGTWEHADEYLSGNVRLKLNEARLARENGVEGMDRNIAALERIVPSDIPYYNIEAKLGNNWTSPAVYRQFIGEMLGVTDDALDGIEVRFSPRGWKVSLDSSLKHRAEARSNFGLSSADFDTLVQHAMRSTPVTVRVWDAESKSMVVSEAESALANEKVAAIQEHFSTWLWKDAARRIELERVYNETYNNAALPVYSGDFLAFEGMMLERGERPFDLRSHQVSAIARGLITGRGLYAHEVGTGKTYTMGGIAVESRRYGKARKPLIFAHNANSATVAAEINEMYPGAKVLYVDNLGKASRAVTLAQIANDDWDAIVVPHSMADRFALRPETYAALAASQIAELEAAALEAAQADSVDLDIAMMDNEEDMRKVRSPTAKDLVRARNRVIDRINKMAQKATENAIILEDAGVDMIIVDEAHEFKKPPIATTMRMKGLNTAPSNRSINLMFMLQYVNGINNGRGVHLFTGTPITNTLNELYNMMRFVMPQEMKADGVEHWDAWFNTFAAESTDVEVTPAGDYQSTTRLASFVNVPELRLMAGQYMDTVFAEDMPEFEDRKAPGGKTMASPDLTDAERDFLTNGRTEEPAGRPYKIVRTEVAEMTEAQRAIREDLMARTRRFRQMTKRERRAAMLAGDPVVPLRVESDAAKAGLDARLFDKDAPDEPDSKVNRAVRNVLSHYKGHQLTCQVIFMEQGFNDYATRTASGISAAGERTKTRVRVPTFNLASDIVEKLTTGGIPQDQIAIVDGSVSKERRKAIAAAMNTGQIRVVIGSTQTLGTGVNMQENLRAMHHLDAPWKPGDLEQRNGRGHRQGNQWNSVFEHRYVTEGIDGRRWQVLVIKERFIHTFLRGTGAQRVIEGDAASVEDEGGNDLLNTLADATGDPRILMIEKARKDVDKLQRRQRLHSEGIYETGLAIRDTKRNIGEMQNAIAVREAIGTLLAESEGKPFEATIEGKTYAVRKDAEEALRARQDAWPDRANARPIGSYRGFGLRVYRHKPSFWSSDTEPQLAAVLPDHADASGMEHTWQTSSGTLAGLDTVLRNNARKLAELRAKVEDGRRSIERLTATLDEPFPQQEQLDKTIARQGMLENDLRINPVPPPSWLRQPTPIGSTVVYGGDVRTVAAHKWSADGWFVVLEPSQGTDTDTDAPYSEIYDDQGIQVYEEHEFEPPAIAPSVNEDDSTPAGDDRSRERAGGARYRDVSESLRPADRARLLALGQRLFGEDWLILRDRVLTPQGRDAMGRYLDGWAEVSTGKGDPESTVLHEAVHRAEEMFLTPDELAQLTKAMPDAEARAEGIVRYAKDGKGIIGAVRRFVERLLRRLRRFLGNARDIDRLRDFYDKLLAGEYARRAGTGAIAVNDGKTYHPQPTDQRYRSDGTVARGERAWAEANEGAIGWVRGFLGDRTKDNNARPDISKWDTLARTIFHYADTVPALKRLYEAADKLADDKHRFGEDIFGERESNLAQIIQFSKRSKDEWKRLADCIRQRDLEAHGYRAVEQDGSQWAVLDLDGRQIATHGSEAEAWAHAHLLEAQQLLASGFSQDAADALLAYRGIADRMYLQLRGQAEELKMQLDALGLEMPTIDDGDGGQIDVFEALRQMGDRRGHYMPRIRTGKFLLHAAKEGENPRTEAFDTRTGRRARAATLRRQGYSVDFEISDRPSEVAFLDMNLVALNDVVQNSIRRMEKTGREPTLEAFGIQARRVQYTRKDGTQEAHLVVLAPKRGKWTEILKDFGGRFYDDKQTGAGDAWHFVAPTRGLEKALGQAVFAADYGAADMTEAFAQVFTTQVAQVIHSRGSRAHKIGRGEATGKNVALGYENDPLRALTMAGKATAGGTAKRIMARSMMQAITGTDIPWQEFKSRYMQEHDLDPDNADSDAMQRVWSAYQALVDERRIDSALQENAYKDGTAFMRDMLRNDEGSDRLFGTVRGIAALKYLSGIAPGVVNATALATTVPAAMKAFGNIPLGRAAGLLARGAKNYVQQYMHARFGKGDALAGEDAWLFDEITRRGWDEALQNMEAIGVLHGKARGMWGSFVDKGLIAFSVTERINRGSTIAAAYYGLRARGVERGEALKQAKVISDKAHGVYGKKNLPAWARGAEPGGQLARSFYMYKTFSHNYLQVLGEMLGKKDWKATAYMLGAPAILGGVGGTVLTPVAALFVQALFSAIPGAEPPDDPEESLYRWLGDTVGEPAERVGRFGLAGLAGVNLKGSLSIGITDLPTDLRSLLGAPYSLFQDFGYGTNDILNGDLYKGAEKIAPRFLSSIMRGYREATEGATTHGNQPIYYGDERLRATWGQALLRALSFNPAGIAEKTERQWNERQAEAKYRDLRGDLFARMRRFALNGGSKADWADILLDVERYNARVRQSPFESIAFITESTIQTQLKRMEQPSRQEKIRSGKADREDPAPISFVPGISSPDKNAGTRRAGRTIRRNSRRVMRR